MSDARRLAKRGGAVRSRAPRHVSHRAGSLIASAFPAVVAALLLVSGETSFAESPAIVPAASVRVVEQALTAALATTRLPATVTPSLQQLAADPYKQEGAITYIRPSCDPYAHISEAAHPQPCWYGASQPTDPVIAVFGDSFVGNWMPALDRAGKTLGYRVADFEFQGCFTAFTPSSTEPGFNQNQVAACNTWHTTLPAAVRRLHPKAIVAASGAQVWRVTQSAWVAGMQLAFRELNPTGTSAEILIGTGIDMPYPAPQCLSSSPSNIQACTYHYTPSSDTQANFTRDSIVAASVRHLHLIPTFDLVCRGGACPLVVSHIVVYADYDHLTVAYSVYLSHVILTALRGILTVGR